jgi:hypothetical protein
MARIPPVRKWRVRYWQGATVTREVTVETINKRFAAWGARDRLGWLAWSHATRVSVSLVKEV